MNQYAHLERKKDTYQKIPPLCVCIFFCEKGTKLIWDREKVTS